MGDEREIPWKKEQKRRKMAEEVTQKISYKRSERMRKDERRKRRRKEAEAGATEARVSMTLTCIVIK